ncbi:hypothetical protein [Clostridium butyricum]|uniref:hypothetical protein n=1 Tax=Clostridium butyricum TaxID=1492 RepID=UPI002AB1719B|nr:hypothetical protein [Clostridium butyricum]
MLILSKCINVKVTEVEILKEVINEVVIGDIVTAEGTDYMPRMLEKSIVENDQHL